jgi:hypothetical protein
MTTINETIRISELPEAASLSMDAVAPWVDQGLTKKATPDLIPFLQSGTGAVARTVRDKDREISISVLDYMTEAQRADWVALTFGTSAADVTTAIQAAHTAAINAGYTHVDFPAGGGVITTLTWSPHVQARALGKVYLRTANASGRTIQVSDEYGLPALYGLNSPRNVIFDGQFLLINTNAGNAATAWSFGGATAANYCNIATPLRGVETRTFHGAVYEFRYNAFLLDIVDCFDYGCNGNRVKIADPVTNTGEGIRFINTIFGTGTSYVMDINTVHVMSFDFIGCSADYTLGLNKPGNSAPLVKVNWLGGHLEWDTVAAAYLQNDGGSEWNIDGSLVAPTALSGWPSPAITKTTGTTTTRMVNVKYVIPGAVALLHQTMSAASRFFGDEYPNYQGGNTPTQFATYLLASIGQMISPQRDPATGWAIDFAQRGLTSITNGGTFDLTTGSGLVILHNDTSGTLGLFIIYAGTVAKVAGAADMVSGAAGGSQIGLAWTGAVYQISNGWATPQSIVIALLKTRTSS